jgi:membrane glycosyltransferase
MAHCGLPKLSGKPPRGGEILSHDFVEATLMARAGWDVWVLPELGGSYEECPPTLYLHARRDRRWCQGDLQNLRLIRAPSLALANRVRFLLASVRNLTSLGVLVLTGLIVGFADPTGQRTCVAAPSSANACLPGIGTVLAVVLPFVIWDLATRMSWAGAPAVGLGLRWAATAADQARPSVVSTVVSEVFGNLLWLITAPDRLMGRTMFVLGFASGRDAGWASLRRLSVQQPVLSAGATSAVRQSLAAVAVVSVLLVVAPWAVWWAAPFLLLWVATAGTTRVLDSERAGRAARRMGLLPTPEEASIPPVVARAGDLRVVFGDALPQSGKAWPVALIEPAAIVLHRAFVAHLAPLTPHDRVAAGAAAHKYRAGGCLTCVEAMALLHAPELVVPALDESGAGGSRTRQADGVAHVVVTFPESTWTPMPQRPPWLGSQGRERFSPRPDMRPEIPFPATTHSDPPKPSTGSRNDPFRHEALPTDVE